MQFDGTFELADTTREEVWLALSDPVLVRNALPGCEFLVRVDSEDPDFDALREEAAGRDWEASMDPDIVADRAFEEGGHYAALMELGVGSVNPSFETIVTITDREFPDMDAEGQGDSKNSSFEMHSGMHLAETDGGVGVEWWTEADVFGRVSQMGQRMINPVANRVVKRFFQRVQSELESMNEDSPETAPEDSESGLTGRIKDRMGI